MRYPDDVDSRLNDAVTALQELPIPPPPEFEFQQSVVVSPKSENRLLSSYRLPVAGFVFTACLLCVIGLMWLTRELPDSIAEYEESQNLLPLSGLVSRSEIRIPTTEYQFLQLKRSNELSQLRCLLDEVREEFSPIHTTAEYERMRQWLVRLQTSNLKDDLK